MQWLEVFTTDTHLMPTKHIIGTENKQPFRFGVRYELNNDRQAFYH